MGRLCLALLTVLLSARSILAVSPPTGFTLTSYSVTLTGAATTTTTTNTITGTVAIALTVTTATTAASTITVNWGWGLVAPAATGVIAATSLATGGTTATTLAVPTYTLNRQAETMAIVISDSLTASAVLTLTITFQTTINRNTTALFARQYINDDATTSTMFSTNLKPNHARDLFPCFDEPSIAVPITLAVTRPSTWAGVASSIAAVTAGTAASGIVTDTFTPGTNSFPLWALNIFITTDMTMTTYSGTGVPLFFWSRKGYAAATLQSNINVLASYFHQVEDLVGLQFPRTNGLHIVLVPNLEAPFAGYGIVYIRDMNYAADFSSAQSEGQFKQNVAPVVYEFLRQYTEFSSRPTTWAQNWMSEAMGRFLQVTLLNSLGLPFDFTTDMDVVARQTALAMDRPTSAALEDSTLDSLVSPVAVQMALSDSLKGYKGPFLMNMLDMALPAGIVFDTIKAFIKANPERFVTSTAFFTLLGTTATSSGAFLSTGTSAFITTLNQWFRTAGYPLITASALTAGTPGTVTLTMTAYCGTASCTNTVPTYSLAATLGSKTSPNYYTPRQDLWVANTAATTASLTLVSTDWVVANLRSSGYYRAQYPVADWTLIYTALAAADDEILGRSQLLDDAFGLALADSLDLYIPLQLAVSNMKEPLFRNWFPVALGLSQVRNRLLGLSDYTTFTAYMTPFLTSLNTLLTGGTLNAYQQAKISSLFFDSMCEFNVGTYRTTATNNVSSLLSGTLPTTVPSSSYDSLVCCAAQYGSSTTAPSDVWATIIRSNATYDIQHYNAIYLGCLSNYTLISTIFTTMLAADKAYSPHILTTLMYVAQVHPSDFIGSVTAIAASIENQIGAPALASLIYMAGSKINVATTTLAAMSTAVVDDVVKTAATATTTAITTRTTWLNTNRATLVAALNTYKLPSSSTSGATSLSVLSLTMLVSFFVATLASVS